MGDTIYNFASNQLKIRGREQRNPLDGKSFSTCSLTLDLVFLLGCSVGWGCRMHRLHLCRGVRPPLNERPGYHTKQSDVEVPVLLELCVMRNASSLPSLPGSLWPGVVASDRILSMGQIGLNCVLMLNWIAWNRTVLTFKLRKPTKVDMP